MGQLLIVADEDRGRLEAASARAVALFAEIAGLAPGARLDDERAKAFWFPPRWRPGGGGLASAGGDGPWSVRVGTWLDREIEPAMADHDLASIDGAFAAVLGLDGGRTIVAVTDKIGTLHLYRRRLGPTLLLSTSSLVLAAIARPDWDPVGVHEFLATGSIFEDRTLFRGIEKLGPARVFRHEAGRETSVRRYWDPADVGYRSESAERCTERLAVALAAAMRRVATRFERPILDLTGGYDSRGLLGAALGLDPRPATVVNGAPGDPDVVAAKRIAARFGLDHRAQALPADWATRAWSRAVEALALTDGEYDLLEYAAVVEFQQRLGTAFEATVNGSGGELCRGYWWELLAPHTGRTDRFDAARVARARFAVDSWCDGLVDPAFALPLAEHFTGVVDRATRGVAAGPNTACLDLIYLELRMQRWQGRIASATARLWPTISPFLFLEPMAAALSAPPGVRIRNRLARRLIERLDRDLAGLPLARGYPALPMRATNLHRFWPLAAELGGRALARAARAARRGGAAPGSGCEAVRGLVAAAGERAELLDPARMRTADLYRPAALETFVRNARDGRVARGHLGRIVTLEAVARTLAGVAIS